MNFKAIALYLFLLFLEIVHVCRRNRPPINSECPQSRHVAAGIVFNVKGQTLHSLKLDIFEWNCIRTLSQVSCGEFKRLLRFNVVAIFKTQILSVYVNVNLGRVLFGVDPLVEFREFD
jgi:hypothetical protein